MLLACDAAARGAAIRTRTRFVRAARDGGRLAGRPASARMARRGGVAARAVVNAAGPWVGEVVRDGFAARTARAVRLVRGSHIVTRRLFGHDRAYIFQQPDGRIVFAIPYEGDFTLIGTTDVEHDGAAGRGGLHAGGARLSARGGVRVLCGSRSRAEDIVWSYSGVRPLYDDGASSATAATRDYVLEVADAGGRAPALNVFGGKITTHRRLAEAAMEKLAPYFPGLRPAWTAGVPLPGGDFPWDGAPALAAGLDGRAPVSRRRRCGAAGAALRHREPPRCSTAPGPRPTSGSTSAPG